MWIDPGDAELRIRTLRDGACPYVDMEGVRARQYVQGENHRTAPPPAGEEIEPFSE
jgi:hypothetical protein